MQQSNDDRRHEHRDPKVMRLPNDVERMEIDFATPRTIEITPINSKGATDKYFLKITPKGGATLV